MIKKNAYEPGLTPDALYDEDYGMEPPLSPVVSMEATIPLPDVSDADLAAAAKARLGISVADKEESDAERLRTLADMENLRKRLAREKEEFIRYSAEKVIADLLPALDTLDLALNHAPRDEGCKDFITGVDMTRKMLMEALGRHGLTETGVLGEEFNPAIHEAVSADHNPDYPPDTVCGLMSKGYRLHDRLLRPARVSVCK